MKTSIISDKAFNKACTVSRRDKMAKKNNLYIYFTETAIFSIHTCIFQVCSYAPRKSYSTDNVRAGEV